MTCASPPWVHRLPRGHFPTQCVFRCGCCRNYRTRCFCVSNHLHLSPQLSFLHILYKCMEDRLTEVSRRVSRLLLSWHHFHFILWVFPKCFHFPQNTWTHRMNLWWPEGKVAGERDSLGLWGGHVHTAIFKVDDQQGPAVQHGVLCSMLCGSLDGRGVWGRMDTYICMAEYLCRPPETFTALLIGYTPIQNKEDF